MKITLAIPKLVAASKRLLEKGEVNIPGIGSAAVKVKNVLKHFICKVKNLMYEDF